MSKASRTAQCNSPPSRRTFLGSAAATAAVMATAGQSFPRFAVAGEAPVRVGILLPYSGTYAMLGTAITDGLKLRIEQGGGRLGGRPVEYVELDSEASPPDAPQRTTRLIAKDKVDFLVGPVHSGVALAMARTVGPRGTPLMIIPNAGANALTRELCAASIFRSSFSNWQPAYPCGKVMADDGHKRIVTMTWNYTAGEELMSAGADLFREHGGEVLKDIRVPFPDVEFQAHLSEIAALQPDAVFAFFSGGGAVKFVKDYAAAGLNERVPLYGPGFLTEGVVDAQGATAEGIKTTLHYASGLDNQANIAFRAAYRSAYDREADVFAVQGYDTGSLLQIAATAVDGDTTATAAMIAAIETATVADSPRGVWRMSKAHNPIQDIYLRQVVDGEHKVLGIAAEALDDPATGCRMKAG